MPIFSDSPKPQGGFELWSWVFMRTSGLLLLFLALGHLVIMHLINSIDVINYDFVAARYQSLFWRGYDFLMLSLAMLHGLNGARIIIDDYIQKEPFRKLAMWALFIIGGIFILLGIFVIIFFKAGSA